jgi:molecular chaperone GrpE
MVHAQFMEALQRLGLEEVPGVGTPFSPEMHEAIQAVPVADAEQDGKVLQVYAKGYRLGTRLIRAAKVVVGQNEG